MRTCTEWEQVIVEYVDGLCQPEAAQRLEKHLACCEACAKAVRDQLWMKQMVTQLERERAPAHLARRIRDHARASLHRRSWTRFVLRWSFAATAVAVVVVALWWNTFRPDTVPTPSSEEPTVAQAIVQEYVGATSSDGFTDPSLQMLTREAQMRVLRLEPTSP
ncbi:MAG: hypothetical protein KatS3mg023_2651 [Armatimonadota bacterium]|nr:MAG: hypothetical protein KatS3mg023_2651 [Armatimonadota bacterium]